MADKPSEMTYADYMDSINTSADAVEQKLSEYPDDYEDLHEAVWEVIDGDHLITDYGYMLVTVFLSDTNPDAPDYGEPWDVYCDLSDEPSWSDAVQAMAYVCVYDDVMKALYRRDDFEFADY